MSNKDNKTVEESRLEAVEVTLSKTEQYIEDNKKSLSIIIGVIILIVGGYLGFQRFVVEPQEKEAAEQIFMAEHFFETDSFNLVLNGTGEYLGVLEIADEYSITKAGNLANYYAGMSYLHLGQFEEAIEYLKQFNSDDEIVMTMAIAGIGDANMELGNVDDAISYYVKATERKPNKFVTPMMLMKLGLAYESQKEYAKALEAYETIQKEYSKSNEGRNIRKYIARAKFENK
jgi:tetratricopeptide (TPR) repeat protein